MSPHAQVQEDAGAAVECTGLWQLSSFPVPGTGADPVLCCGCGLHRPHRLISSGITVHQETESNKSILKK